MKGGFCTEKRYWIDALLGITAITSIVLVFYIPSWWILPEADPLKRWAVWISGYVCGVIVLAFSRWIK